MSLISLALIGSMEDVGSSNMYTLGSCNNALAKESFFGSITKIVGN
ncbi:hypothetical protein X925_04070 [Petrotoga sp. 9T1HF07.CasAA.8.2]|nr:hypothetical protein X925_04070 [Petrotoga sp. 9T1HF07.CasAA.8.2]